MVGVDWLKEMLKNSIMIVAKTVTTSSSMTTLECKYINISVNKTRPTGKRQL